MRGSRSLFAILILMISALITMPLLSDKSYASTSVYFVIDYSESMNEVMGDKKKIDISQEIFTKVLDKVKHRNAHLLVSGHRSMDKCDDIQSFSIIKGKNRNKIQKRLSEMKPLGKFSISEVIKATTKNFKDKNEHRSVILFTDGKMTCDDDYMSKVRKLVADYDYRLSISIISFNTERRISYNFKDITISSRGIYHQLGIRSDIAAVVNELVNVVNNPHLYKPRQIKKDDMVLIPAGEFLMGSSRKLDDPNEQPAHTVYLDSFYIDRYEVTQKHFMEVMGYNPSIWIGSDLPVERVSWFEAKQYCEKIGKRLPTEAEWEKAAKGGRNDRWPGTSNQEELADYLWNDDTGAKGKTHPVGLKKPNGYGIYDMAGNVAEWVNDWFGIDYYQKSPSNNPKGPDKGTYKILRGGNWDSHIIEVRTTSRYARLPEVKYANNGFRCAKSAQ